MDTARALMLCLFSTICDLVIAASSGGAASRILICNTCAVLAELSLVVSIGIASNKVMAKLASLASKPDGIRVIDGPSALQHLLTTTPASRLPRCGGKVAEMLSRAGVHTVVELQVKHFQVQHSPHYFNQHRD